MKTKATGRNFQKSGLFFVLIVLFLITVSLATLNTSHAAATLYVNGTSGNNTWDGTSPTWVSGIIGPKKTIQNASNTVDTSGTVYVASGTYNEHITITKSLNLIGANHDNTIIDGTNNGQAIYVNDAINVVIANFTIRNGTSTTFGGGIFSLADLNINNCIITNNTAEAGGGAIYNYYGTLTITNSTITGNTAEEGGAIDNWFGTLTITNSTITGNTVTWNGGAIINYDGPLTITNSTLTGNTAGHNGGAIFNSDGTVTMHFNRVVNNSPNTIYNDYSNGLIAAENNWWGSNSNPSSQFSGTGTVNYSPWIYMTLTANPALILNGTTSTLTANFNNAYDGTTITPLNPASGHIPDNAVVSFTTDRGNVGSKTTTKNTSNGIATATLTANEGTGIAHITSQLDNQIVNITVGIETLYVNGATGNDTWDGTSPTYISGTAGPMKTIQNAVNTINSGGTINVASGTYNVIGDYYGHINIGKSLNLIGTNPVNTIINGDNNGRLIFIGGGLNVTIANFTLRNGTVSGTGGAIATLSNLTIINCNLTENTAHDGGAIYSHSGTQTIITNSILNGNNATNAGGAISNSGALSVTGSIITCNTANISGGAIYSDIGTLTIITNSTLNGNIASVTAGAIFNMGTLTIAKSTLSENIATNGGGAILNGETGNLTITNSILTGNTGISSSALYNRGTVTMHFNRIVNNSPNAILTFTVIDAENNWWGSNSDPSGQFAGTGTVDYSPWLYMILNANPNIILDGATSTLTANFNNAYDGTIITPLNPASGHIPDNTVVTFTTDLGSVGSPTTTKNTSNGIATATLTADAGIGTANITTQLDSQTLTTTVEITNILYVNGATGDDKYDGLSPTLIIGTKTGPMQTMQNAVETLNKAGIDGTINVASGTYNENLEIETNINLMGNSTNNTIITTPDPNNAIIAIGHIKKAVISGFTIQGAENGIGIAINGGEVTLEDNNIFNNDIGINIAKELKTSTITQNNIKNNNIGISTHSDVNVNFNSLLDNNIDIYTDVEDPINATHNWWGSNSEPSGRTDGHINYDPWLILTVNATPTLIKKDATSTITADLNHDSNGDPVTDHIMDGTPINFTTTLGTITSPQYTNNGAVNTILNGGSVSGIADIETTVDKEKINTPVTVDATAPTVTATDPVNNAVNVSPYKIITVTFSEQIKDGTRWIELKNSSGTPITFTTSITDNILTITPTSNLAESKYTLTIHTGAIIDLSGNPVSLKSTKFSVGTSPTITTIDPTNNAVNIARNKVIKITFNEPIKTGTMWIELKDNIGTLITTTKSVNGNILTITPSTLLATGTKYTLAIHTGAITDQAGNPVAAYTSKFTTTTDGTAPTVTNIDPANNAVDVPTNKAITITYSENIQNGNGWIELKNNSGTPIPTTISISGNTLTITPNSALANGIKYTVAIHTGAITDQAGNPVTAYTSKFTTIYLY